ncbi:MULTISPECIES: hypothetical protein [Streptomyces]|uniref:hypothetical protein n=1 Tax=Streptomyces TaxID=1883 RepID=UPI001E4D6209|nr:MULTISPECIES: hypothetical protein [Streptomyces]UFQ15223.1 hypothetical protein J2N69_09505 [Streptomyces huasconensis]WCL84829.1 hypothetical protein PPN52_09515 [Streptomyces sp. JCM 35825]
MSQTEGARLFREAWITGVRQHFPGEPKAGYVTPWDDTPQWEREAAGSVYEQVRHFVEISGGTTARLSREQKSRFVATCWTAQMFRHFDEPKPGYVADWPDLPTWQQETDADIFEAIEKSLG